MKRISIYMLLLILLWGCRKWDDAVSYSNEDQLYYQILQNPKLSTFAHLLEETGYDKILSGSQTYTVWAPDNEALSTVSYQLLDSGELMKFVGNYIVRQFITTANIPDSGRILALNNKYVKVSVGKFQAANIVGDPHTFSNGVLYVIDSAPGVQKNILEYLSGQAVDTLIRNSILNLNIYYRDSSIRNVIGFDSTRDLPIYEYVGPLLEKNKFISNIGDIADEKKQYTFFIVSDTFWNRNVNNYLSKFLTSTSDSTLELSQYQNLKYLLVDSFYTLDNLPDSLLSTTGVKFAVSKADIQEAYSASNGIVYRVSQLNVPRNNLFPSRYLQGENPIGFSEDGHSSTIFYRIKKDPSGVEYQDLMTNGVGVAQFYAIYLLPEVPSGQYKVYWRSIVGYYDALASFQQKLAFEYWNSSYFPYTTVTPKTFSEVYIGNYTVSRYQNLNVYLVSSASNTSGTLSLDYLRLEPIN